MKTDTLQPTLQEILQTAFSPATFAIPGGDKQNLTARLEEIDRDIRVLKAVKPGDFLPIESRAGMEHARIQLQERFAERGKIAAAIDEINNNTVEGGIKHDMHVRLARHGFDQQLDTAPLSLPGSNGPAFMVSPFDNQSGECRITIEMNRGRGQYHARFSPAIPEPIALLLEKALKDFATHHASRETKAVIAAKFTGSAGDKTKDILAEVAKARATGLFSHILIIADVERWETKEVVEIRRDPLIVGWTRTSQMFYIANYDMSSLEEYFLNAFGYGVTLPQLPSGKKSRK